jgi:hypothetical protein
MKLIINKALDTINDSVNIKIIEITSTDFLNNDLDYFVYKYQIPLIKFTDTEEIFNIKNFKSELSSSLSETEIILDENDLELISSGGGGGSQDLQSVLTQGNSTILDFYKELSYPGLASLKAGVIPLIGSGAPPFTGASVDLENGRYMKAGFLASEGVALFVETNMNDQLELTTAKSLFFKFPVDKPEANYILATLDDILNINLDSRVYANNAAAITGGLVVKDLYRTATGELRIVV